MFFLWLRCELFIENLIVFENKDKFYVEKFMFFICVSCFVVGFNIKKVESISGRRQFIYKGILDKIEVEFIDILEVLSFRIVCIQYILDIKSEVDICIELS